MTQTREEFESVLREHIPELAPMHRLLDIQVVARGVSGRAKEIRIVFEDNAGQNQSIALKTEYRIRQSLFKKFLYSGAFVVQINRDAQGFPMTITLRGAGWGHGVGLCQIGALGMALTGCSHQKTLAHYFPDARFDSVYS